MELVYCSSKYGSSAITVNLIVQRSFRYSLSAQMKAYPFQDRAITCSIRKAMQACHPTSWEAQRLPALAKWLRSSISTTRGTNSSTSAFLSIPPFHLAPINCSYPVLSVTSMTSGRPDRAKRWGIRHDRRITFTFAGNPLYLYFWYDYRAGSYPRTVC